MDKRYDLWICASVIGFSSKDFFSEKNYCGAPGGPNLVIFGIMVHDPLYFEVGICLGPTDPPYMSKNAQMC